MAAKPWLAALDLEGVLTPEIWIAVSEKTGIPALRRTTRDEPDYDKLMTGRLAILKEHGLTLKDIQSVIRGLDPLPGAKDFLDWLRATLPVVILSDTFYQFAAPLLVKLGQPTLFCNALEMDARDTIIAYHLRQRDGKRKAVIALKTLDFRIISVGDSYNDTTMLAQADQGILFRPPKNVIEEFPQYPVVTEYGALRRCFETYLNAIV